MKKRKIETFQNMLGEWVASDGFFECYAPTEREAIAALKAKLKEVRARRM